jgi:ankyrin repeat protein
MAATTGNPNYQGPFGNTLLHGAVVSGDVREVKRLLAAGADPRIANHDGKTAVQAASLLGHAEVYRLLATSDAHLETLLDEALEATFPASDPLAITQPSGSRDRPDAQGEGDAVGRVILPIKRRP